MAEEKSAEATAAYYCPSCGAQYPTKDVPTCSGHPDLDYGHAETELVSSKELAGDEAKHTAAPASE